MNPKTISDTPDSTAPSLAIVGESIFVSYSKPSQIFFTKSNNGGNNFSTPIKISGEVQARGISALAAVGANVYVVWFGFVTPGSETDGIYFVKSIGTGGNFSNPVRISDLSPDASSPAIGASGSLVFVSWVDENNQIAYIRSTDQGATFSAPIILSTPGIAADQPTISAGNGGKDVYVAWIQDVQGEANRQLFVAHSTDFGVTFPQIVIVPGAARPDVPSIVINETVNKVYIAWREDELDPTRAIEFSKSEDSGATFSQPIAVVSGNNTVAAPSLGINEMGSLNLAWVQNEDIFFSRSADQGNTFSAPEKISQDGHNSSDPSLGMSNMGESFVAWRDTSGSILNVLFTAITA